MIKRSVFIQHREKKSFRIEEIRCPANWIQIVEANPGGGAEQGIRKLELSVLRGDAGQETSVEILCRDEAGKSHQLTLPIRLLYILGVESSPAQIAP
jgi:hypothetical protein